MPDGETDTDGNDTRETDTTDGRTDAEALEEAAALVDSVDLRGFPNQTSQRLKAEADHLRTAADNARRRSEGDE